jgi:hypothetical protein
MNDDEISDLANSNETENSADVDTEVNPVQQSYVAGQVQDLKATVLRLAAERERLPQPLFWSLFNTRLSAIRKEKALKRVVDESFNS